MGFFITTVTLRESGVVIMADNKEYGPFTSVQHWKDEAPRIGNAQCSSSLDWPEDVTDNPDLIELADLIRGNNVSGRNEAFNRLQYDICGKVWEIL